MRITLAAALALLLAMSAQGQGLIGSTQSLYVQPGVRCAGMGDCTVAVADDATAASWNPGGLAFMEGDVSAVGMRCQLVPDWEDVYYAHGAAGVRVGKAGVLAASVAYLSYGEQTVTTPDDPNPFATFESYERVTSVAFGTAIGEHVGVGLNLKHVKVFAAPGEVTIDGEDAEGSTFGADLGAEFRTVRDVGDLEMLIRGGGAVQNLGSDIEFSDEEQADQLPRNLKLGASCRLSRGVAGHALLCAQYEKCLLDDPGRESGVVLGFGGELQVSVMGMSALAEGDGGVRFRDLFTLRGGYVHDEDGKVKGTSLGFSAGVEVEGRFRLNFDYARVPQAEGLEEVSRTGGSGWFVF